MLNSLYITFLAVIFTMLFGTTSAFAQVSDDIEVVAVVGEDEAEVVEEKGDSDYWHSGFEVSVQGGFGVEQILVWAPTGFGVDWSVSAGWHGDKYGFSLQFENGHLWAVKDYVEDDEYDDEDDYLNSLYEGYHGAVSAMFDIYYPHDDFVFRVGLGFSILFGMNCEDNEKFVMPRVEVGASWLLTDHLRLGVELEVSTIVIVGYVRPSAVLTYAF